MSTTMVDSWAVDLAQVGPIYPFVGTEFLWVLLGFAFWIIWHVMQMRMEARTYNEDISKLDTPDKLTKAMRSERLNGN